MFSNLYNRKAVWILSELKLSILHTIFNIGQIFFFLSFFFFLETSNASINIEKAEKKVIFSSRNIFNIGQNLIIYDYKVNSNVVIQRKMGVMTKYEILQERRKLQQEYNKACKEADENGEVRPDQNEFIRSHSKPKYGFSYEKPEDKCYLLENDARFCTKNGRISKIMTHPSSENKVNDYFFHQSSYQCKVLSYHIMYNYLYRERYTLFHQYQLRMPYNLYPKLLRVIIVRADDVLTREEINSKELSIGNVTEKVADGLKGILSDVGGQLQAGMPKNADESADAVKDIMDGGSVVGTFTDQDEKKKKKRKRQVKEEAVITPISNRDILYSRDLPDRNLLVFYLSDIQEVGCVPMENLILVSSSEASSYKLRAPDYNLLDQWNSNIDTSDNIFIKSKDGIVIFYKKEKLSSEFKQRSLKRGGMKLNPPKDEEVISLTEEG